MLVAQEVNNGRSSVPLLLVLCSALPEPTSPISPHRLKDQEQWGHYWFSLLLLSSCLGVWQCLLCSGSFVNCITPLIFLSDIGGRTMKLLCQRQRSRKLLLQENVRSWQKKAKMSGDELLDELRIWQWFLLCLCSSPPFCWSLYLLLRTFFPHWFSLKLSATLERLTITFFKEIPNPYNALDLK